MSTAIALQDIGSSSLPKHTSTIRHRTVTQFDTNTSQPLTADEAWLQEPQDAESRKLPLDSRPLEPTAVYWVSPHSTLAKKITVLDLTKDMDVSYTGMTNEYKAQVKKTLKDHLFRPAITCHRSNWLGLKYNITDDENNHLAYWSHPWSSVGQATLEFPDESLHSSHTISLRNKTWGLRTETFTLNSQQFLWEMDSLWHSTNMTLYKVTGGGDTEQKIEVGKYAQKWWGGFVTGGTLVVDEKGIDGVVACLTLIVVLKKKRQRAAERHNAAE